MTESKGSLTLMKKIKHEFTFALKVKKNILHQEENKSGKETAKTLRLFQKYLRGESSASIALSMSDFFHLRIYKSHSRP